MARKIFDRSPSFAAKKFLQENLRKRTATPDEKVCTPQLKREGNPDMNFYDDVNKEFFQTKKSHV